MLNLSETQCKQVMDLVKNDLNKFAEKNDQLFKIDSSVGLQIIENLIKDNQLKISNLQKFLLEKKFELIILVTNNVIKNDINSLKLFLKENNLENLSDPFNKLVENFILGQEEIDVSYCKIGDSDISHFINLKKINAFGNQKITNLNHFKKLTEIDIGFTCGLNDAGICELENLLIIKASDNPKITNLNRFKKLTEINIDSDCYSHCDSGVNDAGICELENLLIIKAYDNPKITNLNQFKKLTEINIGDSCGVNDAGICELQNLIIINASCNTKITNLNRFKKSTEIYINWECGVDDAGICKLENLAIIKASGNTKITNPKNLIRKIKNEAKTINFKIDGTDTTIFDLACSIYKKKNEPDLNEILNEIKVGIFEGLENNKIFYQYINDDLDQKSIDQLKDILDNNNIKTENGLKINFEQFL
jgi:hypothetical protein